MLGEQEATVQELQNLDVHGVTYADVTIRLADGLTLNGRLGPEAVPEGLAAGDRVLAMVAANLLVSLRHPGTP